jgi:putative oxidoreductase
MKTFGGLSLELSRRFPIGRWAPIPLRLIVGYGFMEHGFAKLSRGPDAFATILQAMGVPDPHLMARVSILIELVGGFAVLLGAFVAIVSVPMVALLLVAMVKVHLPYGFSSIKLLAVTPSGAKFGPVGYEVNLLYIACLAALVMGGSGPFAIDRLIGAPFGPNLSESSRGARDPHPRREGSLRDLLDRRGALGLLVSSSSRAFASLSAGVSRPSVNQP